MSCGGRVYKGDSIAISIPFDVSGYTDLSVSYFTIGDTKIVRDESGLTVADGYITAEFSGHDLDLLPDGVVRYTIEYAVDNTDYVESSNTMLYLKTPASYSAKTEDEIFQSGYTTGYNDCGGGDCSEVESIAYNSGITKGMADQRALLGSQTFTSNQTATNPNGWSSVTVNVPHNVRLGTLVQTPLPSQLNSVGQWIQEFTSGGSTDGWDKVQLGMGQMINYGKEQQKALLSSTAITDNGTYTREDGWSSVTVNVTCPACDCTEAYQSGLTVGAAEQKSKLGRTTITTNGTFTTTGDGWSSVTVNVQAQTRKPKLIGRFSADTAVHGYDVIDLTASIGYEEFIFHVDNVAIGGMYEEIPAGNHTVEVFAMNETDWIGVADYNFQYWRGLMFRTY